MAPGLSFFMELLTPSCPWGQGQGRAQYLDGLKSPQWVWGASASSPAPPWGRPGIPRSPVKLEAALPRRAQGSGPGGLPAGGRGCLQAGEGRGRRREEESGPAQAGWQGTAESLSPSGPGISPMRRDADTHWPPSGATVRSSVAIGRKGPISPPGWARHDGKAGRRKQVTEAGESGWMAGKAGPLEVPGLQPQVRFRLRLQRVCFCSLPV